MERILEFIKQFPTDKYQMAVVNTTRPQPVLNLFENTFGSNVNTSINLDSKFDEEDIVVILNEEDSVVTTSPLEKIEESILFVNSDLYRTGSVDLDELDVPSVLESLTETEFIVSGYPESNKEKLPLIAISRQIEKYAYYKEGGTLRSSFQRLSRLKDEAGTYRVYRNISETNTDTHVYGVLDCLPDLNELDLTIHGGLKEDFQSSWFVMYENEDFSVALAAYELQPNYWSSVWTFDREYVDQLNNHIEKTL